MDTRVSVGGRPAPLNSPYRTSHRQSRRSPATHDRRTPVESVRLRTRSAGFGDHVLVLPMPRPPAAAGAGAVPPVRHVGISPRGAYARGSWGHQSRVGDHRCRYRGAVPRPRAAGARHPGRRVRTGLRADRDRGGHRAVGQRDPRVHAAGPLAELAANSTVPTELIYRHWQDGSRIAATRCAGRLVREALRRPLLRASTGRTSRRPSAPRSTRALHLGCRLVNLVQEPDAVGWSSPTAASSGPTSSSGPTACGQGCGGGSPAPMTPSTPGPAPSAASCRPRTCARCPTPTRIQFWMGPDAHLLHYAIGGHGEAVNFFAVVETPKQWLHPGSIAEVARGVAGRLVPRLASGRHRDDPSRGKPHPWALFTVRPLLRWYRDRVVMLGDAAHGMLPHHGQGANTSIEDAFVLAALLADAKGDTSASTVARYQAMRRTRTRKIQRSSQVTSSLLHLPDGAGGAAAQRQDAPGRRRTSAGSISSARSNRHRSPVRGAVRSGRSHDGGDEALGSACRQQVLGAVLPTWRRGRRHADGPVRRGPRHRLAGTGSTRLDRRRQGPVRGWRSRTPIRRRGFTDGRRRDHRRPAARGPAAELKGLEWRSTPADARAEESRSMCLRACGLGTDAPPFGGVARSDGPPHRGGRFVRSGPVAPRTEPTERRHDRPADCTTSIPYVNGAPQPGAARRSSVHVDTLARASPPAGAARCVSGRGPTMTR